MAKSDSFLKTYFSDCQSEMRWRREVEYKLIASMIPLCPALVAGLFALSALLTPHAVVGASLALTAFVWIIYCYVRRKVVAEHKIYKEIGKTVVAIWDHFALFTPGAYATHPMLGEKSKKYGEGDGYKLTLGVFLWVAVTTTAMLLGIGVIAEMGQARGDLWTSSETLRHVTEIVAASDRRSTHWMVQSLEWHPDRREYLVVVRSSHNEAGYSVTVDPAAKRVTAIHTADVSRAASDAETLRLEEAQESLRSLGYYRGELDGVKGPVTTGALRQFQRNHGLETTGNLDGATQRVLRAHPPR